MARKTSALTQYKGEYAGTGTYSRLSNSQHTAALRQRLYKDLGISIESIGQLTPEMVRASSLRVQTMAIQIKYAQIYAENSSQQAAALKELEGIRLSLLKGGDKVLRGLDKDLKSGVEATASHRDHMAMMQQSTAHSLQEIEAKGRSSLEQENEGFLGRLRNLAAVHRTQMSHIKQDGLQARQGALNGIAQ